MLQAALCAPEHRSLGVIQILHVNFYIGVSLADALAPKCLETIVFF